MEQDLSNKQYLRKPESINKIDITDNSQSLPSKIKDEENKRTKFEISENEIIQDQKLKTPNKLDKTPSKKLSLDDFDYIRNLGKGSFGEVILVKKRNDEKLYAMKAIDKNFLYKEKKQYQVYIEKEVLMRLNHPNLPKLYYSFQDKFKLYFVMELCEKGEFSDFLRINKKLDIETIRFYAAEIINILEYLHNNGVAHRDLKPENLMVSANNHLKIIDFGTAYFFKSVANDLLEIINKIRNSEKTEQDPVLDYQSKHKATFVGTAEYVSPELLEDSECAAPADLWALGCIIYRMFVGFTPFYEATEYLMFNKIKKGDFSMSPEIPLNAQNLIKGLLRRNPRIRFGAGQPGEPNDFNALKAHPFFEGIDFENLATSDAPMINFTNAARDSDDFEFDNLNPYKMKKYPLVNEDQKENLTATIQKKENIINNSVLLNQGKILLTGLAMKKYGWLFYQPILLVLKDNKQLIYYDPETNKLKGYITLSNNVQCELLNKTKFALIDPNRKYYFKEIEYSAAQWVKLIKEVISS